MDNRIWLFSSIASLLGVAIWIWLDYSNPEPYTTLVAPVTFLFIFLFNKKTKLPENTGIEDLDEIHIQINAMTSIKEERLKVEFQNLFENHSFYHIRENSIYNSLFIFHRSKLLLERYKKHFSKEIRPHVTNAIARIVKLNSIIEEFYKIYNTSFEIEPYFEKNHVNISSFKRKLPTAKSQIDERFVERCNYSLNELLCTLIKAQLCSRQKSEFCKEENKTTITDDSDLEEIVSTYELEEFIDINTMNHGEKMLKAYFGLPVTKRFEIARELKILQKGESIDSPNKDELSSKFLVRARKGNLLYELWNLLFDKTTDPNPFESDK